MTGIELIAQERAEQIEKHGRTVEQDVLYNKDFQLVDAAENLIFPLENYPEYGTDYISIPEDWNEGSFLKIMSKPYKERLIIAGALIAAEIDRIQNQ